MCDYVNKKELREAREQFNIWINEVQKDIKKEHKITFSYNPIGSGSRNMVIRKCNENFFDLDFQIIIQSIPNNYDGCKKLKYLFIHTFDKFKPENFGSCEDSTQALTVKNSNKKYGFDIIITRYDEENNFYILYNKKNTNNANNKDYEWEKRKDMNKYHERLNLVKGSEMWEYLRKVYKKKRHKYKDDKDKKSYQILNESVVETLKDFDIKF